MSTSPFSFGVRQFGADSFCSSVVSASRIISRIIRRQT
jgi:hypothetical protein